MNLYVISARNNPYLQEVVNALRARGHSVWAEGNPEQSDHRPSLGPLDDWTTPSKAQDLRDKLNEPVAKEAFNQDFQAMNIAEGAVMITPCGPSAHLVAGWFPGAHKPLIVFLTGLSEPELMYNLGMVCATLEEVLHACDQAENFINAEKDVERIQAQETHPHSRRTSGLLEDSQGSRGQITRRGGERS